MAVSVCNELCVVNVKDVVQVPEMPLPLNLFNLYMTKMWLLENIQHFRPKLFLGLILAVTSELSVRNQMQSVACLKE